MEVNHETVKGSCHLFWLEKSGRLRSEVITRRRIKPSEVIHTASYGQSDLFYIQCCNFADTPAKLKGTLCAFMVPNHPKLCIVHHVDVEKDEIVILEWIGQVLVTAGKHRFVPDFYLNSKHNYDEEIFSSTFVPRRLSMRDANLVFLNQVSG